MNDPGAKADDLIRFLKEDTLSAINADRRNDDLVEVDSFTFAIEGLGDCYRSEGVIERQFLMGASPDSIQRKIREHGSSGIVSDDEAVARSYLHRCYSYGNTDISILDISRRKAVLIYVTWTNAPV